MEFRTVATVGALATLPYGLMFALAPAEVGAAYGHAASDAYTLFMSRLFGVQLLLFCAALWGLRGLGHAHSRQWVATALACLSGLGAAVTAWGAWSGAVNAMGWSSVVVYGVFVVLWAQQALASGAKPQTG